MFNQILHAISNSKGPFSNPLFVADPSFIPSVPSIDMQNVRTALGLNGPSMEYYLKVYLCLLEAYPDLKANFGNVMQTYQSTDFLPRGVVISGGEFLSESNIEGQFTDPLNTVLPINLNYWIDYQNEDLLRVTLVEQGNTQLVAYESFGSDPDKILNPSWPATLPFVGQIKLSQPWLLNSRVTISVEPSQFPYELVLYTAESFPYFSTLLSDFGMMEAYDTSADVTERLAIILTCLGMANTAIQIS